MRRSRARFRLPWTSWPETLRSAARERRRRLRCRPMVGGFLRSRQFTAPNKLAGLRFSLAFCAESYSSGRISRVLRPREIEGNSHEKDNRVWGVGPVADFFRSAGGRASWQRRRTRGAVRCGGVWTGRRRGGGGRGGYGRAIDCSFVGF